MKQQKSNNSLARWVLILAGVVLVCSLISWAIMSNWAAAKADVGGNVTQLTNDINHVKDSLTGLNNFASNQTAQMANLSDATDTHFAQVNSSLTSLDSKSTQLRSDVTGLQSQTSDLSAKATDIYNQISTINGQVTTANSNIASVTSTANDTASSLASLTTNVNNIQTSVTNLQGDITVSIPSGIINAANGTDRYIWTANAGYTVTGITFQQSAIEATSATTTLMVKRVPSGMAISSGYDLLVSAVNLKTGVTANTVLTPILNATTSNLTFAAGDSLALNFTNAITEYVGCVTITLEKTQ